MKNPLNRRFLRELRSDPGRYIVIFLLLVISIGFVSGFLVADGSMLKAYDESFEKYNVEDGNFTIAKKASPAALKAMESYDIDLYENFYVQKDFTNNTTLRIFRIRTRVNLACVMAGRLPEKTDEIAIDRMYADNNHLKTGDTLVTGEKTYTISGLIAMSDYSTMFESNDDMMFDAVTFGVACVNEEEFASFKDLTYCYSWKYHQPYQNEQEEKELADQLMKDIGREVIPESFVPRYLNQAITFTGEDMGSDKAMMEIFLYIVIIIVAFVFAINASETIRRESTVIGTLLASGYTRRELIIHYMTLPVILTVVSSLIGNLLGYTVMKEVCVMMYYHSYSLPTYVTIWNPEAFLKTTVIPMILVLLITWAILFYSLHHSPLQFMRRSLRRTRKGGTIRLSYHIPFMSRFRLRVIGQNLSGYLTLVFGILFANILLMFGLLLPTILEDYQNAITSNMLAEYQYFLSFPQEIMDEEHRMKAMLAMLRYDKAVETDNPSAEKFSAYSLKTLPDTGYKGEIITLYGISENSRYIDADITGDEVYVSVLMADKLGFEPGDTFTMKEPYDDDTYTFTIGGIYPYEGAMCVFMNRTSLNRTFDYADDFFTGYFSDEKITDISDQYLGTTADIRSLTKVSRQLKTSMGGIMYLVDVFSVILFIILIYLLSRTILEKNAQSISMIKILGYSDREISRLYILSTSVVVIILLFASLPVCSIIIEYLWRTMIKAEMTGWMMYRVNPSVYIKMILLGLSGYTIVSFLEMKKIRKIPMEEALKNME